MSMNTKKKSSLTGAKPTEQPINETPTIDEEIQYVLDQDTCLMLEPHTVDPEEEFLPFGETIESGEGYNNFEESNISDEETALNERLKDSLGIECLHTDTNPVLMLEILKTLQILAYQLKHCKTKDQQETLLSNMAHLTLLLHY